MLKQKLVEAPILQSPDWSKPFEIMSNASDYAVGAMLGQRADKKPVVIFYASKTFSKSQMNYTTTEKELLVVEGMDLETGQTTTTAKLPILKQVPQTTTNDAGTLTTLIPGPVTTKEKAQKKNDVKARSMLLMALEDCKLVGYLG
nr:eukaryotic peptide chain release factor GTP-binding subunit-like [Tanacetum cinerariifolium]